MQYFFMNNVKKSIFNEINEDSREIIDILLLISKKKYFESLKKCRYPELYKFLLNKRLIKNPFKYCIVHSDDSLFIYTFEKGYDLPKDIYDHIIRNDKLSLIQYLVSKGINCKLSSKTTTLAARIGDLDNLKYLVDLNCPIDENTFHGAVKSGNLECVKYLHEKNCSWDKEVTNIAVKYNNLEILKYLIQNNAPFDSKELFYSGVKNDISDLMLLNYNKGFGVNMIDLHNAFETKNLDCLFYLYDLNLDNCPISIDIWLRIKRNEELPEWIASLLFQQESKISI